MSGLTKFKANVKIQKGVLLKTFILRNAAVRNKMIITAKTIAER